MAKVFWSYSFLVAWDTKEHLLFRVPQALHGLKAQCFKGVSTGNPKTWRMLLEWILSCFSLLTKTEVELLPSVGECPVLQARWMHQWWVKCIYLLFTWTDRKMPSNATGSERRQTPQCPFSFCTALWHVTRLIVAGAGQRQGGKQSSWG